MLSRHGGLSKRCHVLWRITGESLYSNSCPNKSHSVLSRVNCSSKSQGFVDVGYRANRYTIQPCLWKRIDFQFHSFHAYTRRIILSPLSCYPFAGNSTSSSPSIGNSNICEYIKKTEVLLGISNPDDWYSVPPSFLFLLGGKCLLQRCYLYEALILAYPEHAWDTSRFGNGFSYDDCNRCDVYKENKAFFDNVMNLLNITNLDGWYEFSVSYHKKVHIKAILDKYYSGDLWRALFHVYPYHKWRVQNFYRFPAGYWSDYVHIRMFLIEILEEKGGVSVDALYDIRTSDVMTHGGKKMFAKNKKRRKSTNSITSPHGDGVTSGISSNDLLLRKYIRICFPEYTLHSWRFYPLPRGYWFIDENGADFLSWIFNELGLKTMNDWYRVSCDQIFKMKGDGLIKRFGSVFHILNHYYPDTKWDRNNFLPSAINEETAISLKENLVKYFPYSEVFHQYTLRNDDDDHVSINCDFYMPKEKLAIIYEKRPHYLNFYKYRNKNVISRSMMNEKTLCKKWGVSLAIIPYWWDRSEKAFLNILSTVPYLENIAPHNIDFEISSEHNLDEKINANRKIDWVVVDDTFNSVGVAKVIQNNEDTSLLCRLPNNIQFVVHYPTLDDEDVYQTKELMRSAREGSMINYKFHGDFEEGRPCLAIFDSLKEQSDFIHEYRSATPFYLCRGKSKGAVPGCKGCGEVISNREGLRVGLNASLVPGLYATPFSQRIFFHLSSDCISKAKEAQAFSKNLKIGAVIVLEDMLYLFKEKERNGGNANQGISPSSDVSTLCVNEETSESDELVSSKLIFLASEKRDGEGKGETPPRRR